MENELRVNIDESTIEAFRDFGMAAERCAKALNEIANAMPEDLIRAMEAEVKRRESLAYRIRRRLPWCKEFYLSR